MCTCMCRVCPCVQGTRSCGLQTHVCMQGVWACCVHAHVQAGLACRGCKVCRGCVRPAKHSGTASPREGVGLRRGCSPLPSLTCPGHRLHRDPSFTECLERNFCFFIPPEHPSLQPLKGRQHPAQPQTEESMP